MGTTPRTYDDGRNEKQRAKHDSERDRLLDEKPFDFIEKTKPEDRLGEVGQQTRDNVNPAIPSAEPGKGGIVDPRSLGMESQGGVAPPAATPYAGENVTPDAVAAHMPSINEPFGSNLTTGDAGPAELPPLTLTAISPDRVPVQPASITEIGLQVTGTGFTPETVVLFDDEEVPTTFISPTRLDAVAPLVTTPGAFDVEVQRGEDLSDVLVFEIVTAESGSGARSSKEPARKPKKDAPASKRTKSKRSY
jgi:hypothetical protein